MKSEYVAFLALGVLIGLAAYAAVSVAWVLNFAWQNALAG